MSADFVLDNDRINELFFRHRFTPDKFPFPMFDHPPIRIEIATEDDDFCLNQMVPDEMEHVQSEDAHNSQSIPSHTISIVSLERQSTGFLA